MQRIASTPSAYIHFTRRNINIKYEIVYKWIIQPAYFVPEYMTVILLPDNMSRITTLIYSKILPNHDLKALVEITILQINFLIDNDIDH